MKTFWSGKNIALQSQEGISGSKSYTEKTLTSCVSSAYLGKVDNGSRSLCISTSYALRLHLRGFIWKAAIVRSFSVFLFFAGYSLIICILVQFSHRIVKLRSNS